MFFSWYTFKWYFWWICSRNTHFAVTSVCMHHARCATAHADICTSMRHAISPTVVLSNFVRPIFIRTSANHVSAKNRPDMKIKWFQLIVAKWKLILNIDVISIESKFMYRDPIKTRNFVIFVDASCIFRRAKIFRMYNIILN